AVLARENDEDLSVRLAFVLIGYSLWRIYAFLRQTRKVETFRDIVENGIDADRLGRFDDRLEEGKGRGWCLGDFETAGDRDGFGWGRVLRGESLADGVTALSDALPPFELLEGVDRDLADYEKQFEEYQEAGGISSFEEARGDLSSSFEEAKDGFSDSSSSERASDSEESKGDEPFRREAERHRRRQKEKEKEDFHMAQLKGHGYGDQGVEMGEMGEMTSDLERFQAQHHWEERSKKLVAKLCRSSVPGSFLAQEAWHLAEMTSEICQQVACPSYTELLITVMEGMEKKNDPLALINHVVHKIAVRILSCAEPERRLQMMKLAEILFSDPCPQDPNIGHNHLAVYLTVQELARQEQTAEVKRYGMTFLTEGGRTEEERYERREHNMYSSKFTDKVKDSWSKQEEPKNGYMDLAVTPEEWEQISALPSQKKKQTLYQYWTYRNESLRPEDKSFFDELIAQKQNAIKLHNIAVDTFDMLVNNGEDKKAHELYFAKKDTLAGAVDCNKKSLKYLEEKRPFDHLPSFEEWESRGGEVAEEDWVEEQKTKKWDEKVAEMREIDGYVAQTIEEEARRVKGMALRKE
ncbi:hypothetical protein TeGR_g5, partial [Tetraparma gracilis]